MKHIKSHKIFESGQVFDYESNKTRLIGYIEAVKNKKEPFLPTNLFYSILRGKGLVGTAEKLGFTKEQKVKFKEFMKSSSWISDGAWSQIDYNREIKSQIRKKLGKHIDYNYYITIIKEKENILKFVKSINDLNQRLHKLAYQKNTALTFKTHTLLDMLCGDNDSLKVYYYDTNLKSDIEKIIQEWSKTNEIKLAARTHTHGVDVKKGDEDKKSWGIIISEAVDEEFRKVINQYGNKFTNEQYYEWFKSWFPKIIKNINFKS